MYTDYQANTITEPFISENFVLESDPARALYFDFVRDLPIVDYHNHLPPNEIAEDKRYANMTEIWLKGDHYKWRAMRANGVPEELITGHRNDWEKFLAWSKTVPYTMRNPLQHWTQMELKHPFGIDDLLTEQNARAIYDSCNEQLQNKLTARALLEAHKVQVVCTTDDPTDDLQYHSQYAAEGKALKMYPTFRPDTLLPANTDAWRQQVARLVAVSGIAVTDLDSLLEALVSRIDAFHELGCRASDHGLERLPPVSLRTVALETACKQLLAGETAPDAQTIDLLQGYVLLELCRQYAKRGWVQQFHLGALRNISTRLYNQLGVNVGGDSMGDWSQTQRLARFLDALDQDGQLAKTVLYNLNPADNETFATMIGNFQDGSVPGKIQWGSGWWFLDQKDGMEKQLNTLSNMGLMSRFIGMVTDSRSFLSFSRHDYFRRILCNVIGQDIQRGLVPNDLPWLGQLAANISYYNTVDYFGWTIK
ncbi:glucuronate isomerase [Fibrella forsythiae]|uniref:Uronate isomerase n=1 Tax=Fibrella forsythiae TaxID=2817061 RepID=A0ABS3JN56_9BACT|nr:glucuronate isomerase [Fibrella forsythiae]MBO0951445.1 glucuronate isomerase [Fibrella forsythiae]